MYSVLSTVCSVPNICSAGYLRKIAYVRKFQSAPCGIDCISGCTCTQRYVFLFLLVVLKHFKERSCMCILITFILILWCTSTFWMWLNCWSRSTWNLRQIFHVLTCLFWLFTLVILLGYLWSNLNKRPLLIFLLFIYVCCMKSKIRSLDSASL